MLLLPNLFHLLSIRNEMTTQTLLPPSLFLTLSLVPVCAPYISLNTQALLYPTHNDVQNIHSLPLSLSLSFSHSLTLSFLCSESLLPSHTLSLLTFPSLALSLKRLLNSLSHIETRAQNDVLESGCHRDHCTQSLMRVSLWPLLLVRDVRTSE